MATVAPHRVRPGRALELVLLLVALAVAIAAYALVGLATSEALPADLGTHAGVLAVLALGMHLVLRRKAPWADPVILPVAVALNGLGLAMISRIDIAYALRERQTDFGGRQLMWTVVGMLLAAAVLFLLRDHRTLRRFTYTAMVAALVLMVLPLVPGLGANINGAQIWIRVAGASFQPAELGKIALAIFFAGYLVTTRDTLTLAGRKVLGLQLPRTRDLGPILVAWIVSLGVLVFERDLGTSLLFFGLFVAMLYLATERISWVVIGLGLVVGGVVLAAQTFSHVAARFDAWLHAFDNSVFNASPGGSGQLVRGLFGMASGGLFGTGLGQGRPDLVPYAESDFIVASIGEELGLTGLMAVLVLYLVLTERGMRTAVGVRDGFGKLFAGGIAFTVAFQCFVVVGGVTRLIPLTGLTMPFLAYGGSSLLANWVIVALLLRISDSARRPADAPGLPTPERSPGAAPAVAGSSGPRPAGDDQATERIRLRAGSPDSGTAGARLPGTIRPVAGGAGA
ncbi:FtsW/RodA/SpoVE family cell cycle protein [Actinotalea sp.]|uniref:FtsW/RodA/SpoVE family cell cycle protein n=1 Tax=Actinotalea sp. TaxID=1872145 RepID=UPI0035635A43